MIYIRYFVSYIFCCLDSNFYFHMLRLRLYFTVVLLKSGGTKELFQTAGQCFFSFISRIFFLLNYQNY